MFWSNEWHLPKLNITKALLGVTPLNRQTKGAFTPNLFGAVQTDSGASVHLVQFVDAGVKDVKLYRAGLERGVSVCFETKSGAVVLQ